MGRRLVEIGRVVYVTNGPAQGKLAVIVDVVDGNKVLLDGPCSGVNRRGENLNNVQLTRFKVPVRNGARTGTVKKAWEAVKMTQEWDSTVWAKKLRMRALRANMSDFDRFKLMKAKQKRNRILKMEMGKLKKAAKK